MIDNSNEDILNHPLFMTSLPDDPTVNGNHEDADGNRDSGADLQSADRTERSKSNSSHTALEALAAIIRDSYCQDVPARSNKFGRCLGKHGSSCNLDCDGIESTEVVEQFSNDFSPYKKPSASSSPDGTHSRRHPKSKTMTPILPPPHQDMAKLHIQLALMHLGK